ncbi:cell division protein ZapA [Aestuariibius sp. 2305UL40-4]|uniref:cell division protein ZapA n=1 Tax=Aestuariibius violaceus TaxID=3234132 RepID=UPI00345ED76A
MPVVKIEIGGRPFEVSCQDGEEDFLMNAARMLDEEAQALSNQIGRMPESRMLLMAGLMLADKTASMEEKIRSGAPVAPSATGQFPGLSVDALKGLAEKAEALAAQVEARPAE